MFFSVKPRNELKVQTCLKKDFQACILGLHVGRGILAQTCALLHFYNAEQHVGQLERGSCSPVMGEHVTTVSSGVRIQFSGHIRATTGIHFHIRPEKVLGRSFESIRNAVGGRVCVLATGGLLVQ